MTSGEAAAEGSAARPNRQLWLLAGGNGAGKSTFYRLYLEPRGVQFVNADLIARHLAPDAPQQFSYEAARWAEKLRERFLDEGLSFCFETVFSHPSKIDFVAEAKARGYQVLLVYVHLENDSLNQARVRQRVSEGGHDVPAEKIVSRIPRTLVNVSIALLLVDDAWLLDNSSRENPFRQVARIRSGAVTWALDPLPGWAQSMLSRFRIVATEPVSPLG